MEEHMEACFTYGGCKVRMPEEGKNIIEFTQINKQIMAPYTIYSDCEAIIKKEEEKQTHEIFGFNISVVSPYEKTQSISYRGDKAGKVLMEKMEELSEDLYRKIKNADAKKVYTAEDMENFNTATQ